MEYEPPNMHNNNTPQSQAQQQKQATPQAPMIELIPTELSKRVQELIYTTEGTQMKAKTSGNNKDKEAETAETAAFVSERSKGIYSLVNELFAQQKDHEVTFQELVSGCSKTTAARCFLEILQLKTADKLHVTQDTAFGTIQITPVMA